MQRSLFDDEPPLDRDDEDAVRAARLPRFDETPRRPVSGRHVETHDTSAEAAERATDTQRQAVLEVIVATETGMTDDDVQQVLAIDGNSERPRRRELETRGLIQLRRDERGEVVRRLTRTGRWAVVWVAAS